MRKVTTAAAIVAVSASLAFAGDVPVERNVLNGAKVVLHVHPFLDATELATLRLVLTNPQALALFLPDNKGFAAIAVAPDEGFIRAGAPVASASALGGLPDAAAAATQATAACDAKRAASGQACVLVLEVGPGG
jgi:hypothetical protein